MPTHALRLRRNGNTAERFVTRLDQSDESCLLAPGDVVRVGGEAFFKLVKL